MALSETSDLDKIHVDMDTQSKGRWAEGFGWLVGGGGCRVDQGWPCPHVFDSCSFPYGKA